jgi:hypothetical protein
MYYKGLFWKKEGLVFKGEKSFSIFTPSFIHRGD